MDTILLKSLPFEETSPLMINAEQAFESRSRRSFPLWSMFACDMIVSCGPRESLLFPDAAQLGPIETELKNTPQQINKRRKTLVSMGNGSDCLSTNI